MVDSIKNSMNRIDVQRKRVNDIDTNLGLIPLLLAKD